MIVEKFFTSSGASSINVYVRWLWGDFSEKESRKNLGGFVLPGAIELMEKKFSTIFQCWLREKAED